MIKVHEKQDLRQEPYAASHKSKGISLEDNRPESVAQMKLVGLVNKNVDSQGFATGVIQKAGWNSPSLGRETNEFVDPKKEEETYREFVNLRDEAAHTYEEQEGAVDEFFEEDVQTQASYLPEKDRQRYIRLSQFARMKENFRHTADKNQNEKGENIFERHHILSRSELKKFHKKLNEEQHKHISKTFGKQGDLQKGDAKESVKILQSLRSNLFIGPANRNDTAKENLDLLYDGSGELEAVSIIYRTVSGLINRFLDDKHDDHDKLFTEIMEQFTAAENIRPTVRMVAADWSYDEHRKNWRKTNTPQSGKK